MSAPSGLANTSSCPPFAPSSGWYMRPSHWSLRREPDREAGGRVVEAPVHVAVRDRVGALLVDVDVRSAEEVVTDRVRADVDASHDVPLRVAVQHHEVSRRPSSFGSSNRLVRGQREGTPPEQRPKAGRLQGRRRCPASVASPRRGRCTLPKYHRGSLDARVLRSPYDDATRRVVVRMDGRHGTSRRRSQARRQ